MTGSKSSEPGCGHGPWTRKRKVIPTYYLNPQNRISWPLINTLEVIFLMIHMRNNLTKAIPYVKLHSIPFSPGWKLAQKMFCLPEHFPLGAKGLMMYNLSWRFDGKASQSKHCPPVCYIALTNRNAEPFNYQACLTHSESQTFWQCLSEGGKCTEFPELLVKTMSTKKLVNTLLAQEETWVCTVGTPRGSVSAPFFHPAALHPTLLMHWALHYKHGTQEQ